MNFFWGLFFLLHGLIHTGYLTPKPDDPNYPFALEDRWFASFVGDPARAIGTMLAVIAVVGFIAAGLAVFGVPGLGIVWKWAIVVGSIASLLLMLLFWHNWLMLGVAIDVVLLYAVLYLQWSPIG